MIHRKRSLALLALAGFLLAAAIPPALAVRARADAEETLTETQAQLDRLLGAERRATAKANGSGYLREAPIEAFLDAQTPGLATAQLEAHLAKIAASLHANLVSSSAQQPDRSDGPDTIRVQANIELDYDALPMLLYKLESGEPYVFVESLALRPVNASASRNAHNVAMRVSFGLKALWRAARS
jgi:general secretion pathway protein M